MKKCEEESDNWVSKSQEYRKKEKQEGKRMRYLSDFQAFRDFDRALGY